MSTKFSEVGHAATAQGEKLGRSRGFRSPRPPSGTCTRDRNDICSLPASTVLTLHRLTGSTAPSVTVSPRSVTFSGTDGQSTPFEGSRLDCPELRLLLIK